MNLWGFSLLYTRGTSPYIYIYRTCAPFLSLLVATYARKVLCIHKFIMANNVNIEKTSVDCKVIYIFVKRGWNKEKQKLAARGVPTHCIRIKPTPKLLTRIRAFRNGRYTGTDSTAELYESAFENYKHESSSGGFFPVLEIKVWPTATHVDHPIGCTEQKLVHVWNSIPNTGGMTRLRGTFFSFAKISKKYYCYRSECVKYIFYEKTIKSRSFGLNFVLVHVRFLSNENTVVITRSWNYLNLWIFLICFRHFLTTKYLYNEIR